MKKIHIIPANGNGMQHNPIPSNCLEHRLFVCSQQGFTVFTIKDIYYIKAARAKSVFFTVDYPKGFIVPISITELQERLSGVPFFFKPHRSYLINLHHLKSCCTSNGILSVSVCPGARSKSLPIAENQQHALQDALQSLGWQELRKAR